MADEKDPLGRIPLRTELTVLPAADPNRLIGWTVQQYDGMEVHRFAPDGSVDETPLTAREDIQEGMELAVPGLFGGYHKMVVERVAGHEGWWARVDKLSASLRWNIDDRHCWTISSLINTRGLKALEIKS